MDPREKSAELFYSALDLVSRTTGSADSRLSRALGHGADFVGYAKRRRKRSASLEEIFGVLAVTGQPDCVVFGKLFPQPAPAELLRLVCDADPRHRQAEPPLLARVRKVCEGLDLRQLKSAETLAWPRRMILGVIDELRFTRQCSNWRSCGRKPAVSRRRSAIGWSCFALMTVVTSTRPISSCGNPRRTWASAKHRKA
jgi:hypothetical protein